MQLIKWLDIYEIGVSVIDNQHKHLIFLINDTYKALLSHKDKNIIIETALDKFLDFYSEHFITEEKFMQLIDFPLLFHHKDLHSEILATLYSYKKEYKEDNEINIESFFTLMNQWIFEHLTSEDMKIKDHLQYLDKEKIEKYNDELEAEKII